MNWKHYFRSHILSRGYGYYLDNMVHIESNRNNIVKATVEGTELYSVYIDLDDLDRMQCTCPYYEDGHYCKHLAATLYEVFGEDEYDDDDDYDEYDEYDEEFDEDDENSNIYFDYKDEVDRIIEQCDQEELILLLKLALNNPNKAVESVLNLKTKYPPKFDNDLDEIFFRYSDKYGVLKSDDGDMMVEELKTYVRDHIIPLIEVDIPKALKLTQQLSEKNGLPLQMNIEYVWEMLISNCEDMKVKMDIFNYLDDKVQNYYCMKGLQEIYCIYFNEPIFQYKKKKTLQRLLHIYLYNKLDNDMLKVVCESYLNVSTNPTEDIDPYLTHFNVQKIVVAYLVKRNQQNDAIEMLKKYIQAHPHIPYVSLRETGKLLCDLYEQNGYIEQLKAELYNQLITFNNGQIDVFCRLKKLYSPTDWEKMRDKIIAHTPLANVCNYYIEEEMYERLLATVKNNYYQFVEYEKILSQQFPKEVISIYMTKIENIELYMKNRKDYQFLTSVLSKMSNLKEGKEVTKYIRDKYKNKYKNRSALIDELNKLSL